MSDYRIVTKKEKKVVVKSQTGVQGPAGVVLNFESDFIAITNRVFTHNLGKKVTIEVFNIWGETIYPEVQRIDQNNVELNSNTPISGTIIIY